MTTQPPDPSKRTMVVERLVHATPDVVWKAWTHPTAIEQWWGPNGFRTTNIEMDVRVGGVWRFVMHGPDGTDYSDWIVYRELSPPSRMVYDHGSEGTDARAFQTTVTFEPRGEHTFVTLKTVFDTQENYDAANAFGATQLGQQTLARLDAFVQGN